MKRIYITLLAVFATFYVTAQDVIFLSSNDSIVAKVISVGTSEITYKKWTNLEGPTYSVSIHQIIAIQYANGTYDSFSSQDNQTSKGNYTSILLSRSGNKYFYDKQANNMNKKETLAWLATQHCPEAYNQFKRGLVTANVGWGLMATGLTFTIIGSAIYRTKLVLDKNGNYTSITQPGGPVLIAIGSVFVFASIPTISVGYSKMHKAVHTYNACNKLAQAKPYWTIQASSNGLGIAYNF